MLLHGLCKWRFFHETFYHRPRCDVLVFLLLSCLACAEGDYHLIMKYTLSGGGGWDHITVDASARRINIAPRDHVKYRRTDVR